MSPMEAALQGRRRDRLHHHLDLGVAGGGVHPAAADGRHRRPAVPRVRGHGDADHRRLGDHLADPHADAVLALPEERARDARTAASTSCSSAASTRCSTATSAACDVVLKHQFITLMVFFATLAATVVLFIVIPKGFFPQQDTGFIFGNAQVVAGLVVRVDEPAHGAVRRHRAPGSRRRPASACSATRRSSTPATSSSRSSRRTRAAPLSADEIIARLRPKLAQGRRRVAADAGGAGHQRRRPPGAHAVPVHADRRQPRRAQRVGAEAAGSASQQLPQLTDVASDLQNAAPHRQR